MTTFDERESAYENKYAHDEETAFKINAKRNKLLAGWAAGQMRLNEVQTQEYVQNIVISQIDNSNPQVMIDKIYQSMVEAGVNVDRIEVEKQMDAATVEAQKQFAPQ